MAELDHVDDLELLEEYDLNGDQTDDSRSEGERGHGRGAAGDQSEEELTREEVEAIHAEMKATTVEIVSALGGLEEKETPEGEIQVEYIVGDDCLRCLRDLRRLWQEGAEDPTRAIAHVFAEVGVLQNLIPLLLKTSGGSERYQKIALATTDLLTSITWPVDAAAEIRDAIDRGDDIGDLSHLFALEAILTRYKAAILRQRSGETIPSTALTPDRHLIGTVMRHILLPCLAKPRPSRSERDIGTISMVLHLFRNLLVIRDPIATTLSSAEQISLSNLQSELICSMAKSHVLETILMLANSAEGREFGQWNAIVSECIYSIFGGERAGTIAGVSEADTVVASGEKTSDGSVTLRTTSTKLDALASALTSEAHQRTVVLKNSGNTRHSRFGTTLNFYTPEGDRRVARNAPSIRKTVEELRQENEEKGRRKRWRRRKIREQGAPRLGSQWTSQAGEILRDWADRFLLSGGFETLTRSVLEDIRRGREKMGDLDAARIRIMLLAAFFLDYFLIRRSLKQAQRLAKPQQAASAPSQTGMASTKETETSISTSEQTSSAQADPPTAESTSPPRGSGSNAEMADADSPPAAAGAVSAETVASSESAAPAASEAAPANNAIVESESWPFSLLAYWLQPWAFTLVRLRTDNALESKQWLEVKAALQVWMSLLRLTDALTRSDDETEHDVAEGLQANHFYHSETLEICHKVARCYTSQSIEFLETIIAFANVMPRMLEKYSLNKEHIFVRAKRHMRKAKEKRQAAAEGQGNDEDDQPDGYGGTEEEETKARAEDLYTDRRFSFDRFQNKLCCRPLVEACVMYLGRWRDFNRPAEQLGNVITLMHRIAIKAGDVRSFYPAHIRMAFNALEKSPMFACLQSRAPRAVADAMSLIKYCLSKFKKLAVEEQQLWVFGQRAPKLAKAIKIPREIEVRPGFSHDEQVGIAVGLLNEKQMMARVMWVKDALEVAAARRTEIVLTLDGKRMWDASRKLRIEEGEGNVPEEPSPEDRDAIIDAVINAVPSEEAVAKFEPYVLDDNGDSDLRNDVTTAPAFKMFARLLGLESDEDDTAHWQWRISSAVLPTHLESDIRLIDRFIAEPMSIQDETTYESYTQNSRKPRVVRAKHLAPEDVSDGNDSDTDSSGSSSASSNGEPRKKRGHRRRKDLIGDVRKKKGFSRRPASSKEQPQFLDMIDSDEEEQVEAMWRAKYGASQANPNTVDSDEELRSKPSSPASSSAGRARPTTQRIRRATSASDTSSTPPTSPPLHQTAGSAKAPQSQRRGKTSQPLFFSSDEDDDDDGDDGAADKTAQPVSATQRPYVDTTESSRQSDDLASSTQSKRGMTAILSSDSESEAPEPTAPRSPLRKILPTNRMVSDAESDASMEDGSLSTFGRAQMMMQLGRGADKAHQLKMRDREGAHKRVRRVVESEEE